MARLSRITFSNQNLNLIEIATQHFDVEHSLRNSFIPGHSLVLMKYPTDTADEIRVRLVDRLGENDIAACMNLLASIEARFRVDYFARCYRRLKDELSRAMRELYSRRGEKVSLEDEIFEHWKRHTSVPPRLISELRGAFRYRHWIAHGRYWVPKLGQKYDFFGISVLAQTVQSSLPFERPD